MAALNFHHLRYFHAIAQAGGLGRAAERLNVSASALSIQLRELEAQLGHALFERRGRGLELTEAGRIALDRAEAIFAAGEDLVSTLRGRGAARTALRVGALSTLSRNFQLAFLAPALGRDDTEIVLRSGALRDLLSGLESHGLDVVLSTVAPPRDAVAPWIVHPLASQPVSLIAHRDRAAAVLPLRQWLTDEPILLPSPESGVRADLDALFQRLGIRPRIAAEVDDMAMLRLLARENAGLVAVPPIVVRDELDAGTLVELQALEGVVERFFAIVVERRFPNPLVQALIAAATQ
jgi:LysR family transcriptional activator of nhaA